jgi:ubiquitin-activating enzyme E1
VGAQEVLKAATGLYNPVKQFLLYDCDEVLESANSGKSNEDSTSEKDIDLIAKGQSYILGNDVSAKLASSRIFLVGAGAIGCELLKNLASMGAGTFRSASKHGCLIVTDMDTIEKSNLSRQLLFRDHDVGDFKSAAARTAVLRFAAKGCNVEAHTSRVGEEEDGPFDDDFWSSGCDVVLNALDNVEARLFVDGQCVSNGRGLIDAGTLGSKGNVQVVVPYKSESYGSSADPPEPDIPVCTLKNFPYDISHTIQWARDLFDGYFHRRPRQANDHVGEIAQMEDLTNFAQMLIRKFGEDAAKDMAEELGEDIGVFPFAVGLDSNDPEYISAVKRISLSWAIRQAERLFYVAIEELLQKHPIDSVDEEGAPFWTGSRRVPSPLRFKALNSGEDEVSAQQVMINERIAQFVQSAARLRMESFLIGDNTKPPTVLVSLEDALSSLDQHASSYQDEKEHGSSNKKEGDVLSDILEKLNGAKTGASFLPSLNLVDFEKDDESNGHVSFVTAASNLRAMAYGIPAADAMETRRVAGRIVPAMITTTGLVSALSCLELIKMLKGLPLTMHRNAFVNLALPFFAFTVPLPAEQVLCVDGRTYTMWDRIIVRGSSKSPAETMTLEQFIGKVKKAAGLGENMEVSNISYGPYMIFASFLNSGDDELLRSPLIDTVKSAVISEDGSDETLLDEEAKPTEQVGNLSHEQNAALSKLANKRYIDFSIAVEDPETGLEYELPPIRLVKEKRR